MESQELSSSRLRRYSTSTEFEVTNYSVLDSDVDEVAEISPHTELHRHVTDSLTNLLDSMERLHRQSVTTTSVAQASYVYVPGIGASNDAPPVRSSEPTAVPLHALVRFGSAFSFLLCASSILMWVADYPAVITPFAAMLGMFISPFFYSMGKLLQKQRRVELNLSA